MNKLKKVGLSALAGSLVALSVNAGEMAVTGSASLTYSNSDEGVNAGGFTMSNSIFFNGSGEMDNGMTISMEVEFDGDEGDDGEGLDNHSLTLDTNGSGVIKFVGHGGTSVVGAMDDKMPTAYEEAWDAVSGADADVVNGSDENDSFGYTSPSINGAVFMASYHTGDNAKTSSAEAYADWGVTYSGVEGLELGYASGTTEAAANTEIDESTLYATYAAGPVTVGVQMSEADSSAASADIDTQAFGISYAISDDFSVSYGQHEIDYDNTSKSNQESTGIGFSYTMGSMSFGGTFNQVDNVAGTATTDRDGVELNLGMAF